jgi:putative glutamine amidotransferase
VASNDSDSSVVRPILGLTTYLQQAQTGVWDVRASFLPAIYVDGVTMAGGIATLLPPQPVDDDIAARVLDGLDGLIVTGGRDVDPAAYGQPAHPTTDEPARDRDAFEFALVRGALARRMPVLGICRGAQVLNVALGGTLHQHLPDVLGHHRHRPEPGVYGAHRARFADGSRIAGLMGDDLEIHCYHHQGVADPGTLQVTGWAEDGLPEAVEDPAHQFVLGVQWHPEVTRDKRLFGALVDAARHRADPG